MNVSTVQLSAIPAITIFVRHRENCPRAGDENYKACKCSQHLRWSANGKQHRKSAKTRTWAIAEESTARDRGNTPPLIRRTR
jgi:hypothetical protein